VNKTFFLGISLCGILFLLTACSSRTAIQPTQTETVTPANEPILPPTLSATSTVTLTSIPATLTSNLIPQTPTRPSDNVLTMKPGRTAISIDGDLVKNNRVNYLIDVKAGQYLLASLSTTDQTLSIEIVQPNHNPLLRALDQLQSWQGILPVDGQYQVSVVSKELPGNYNLSITVPVQVIFNLGSPSITLEGSVDAHQITTYMVKGEKDQTMGVNINVPGNDVFLTIYGLQDGQPYIRSVTGNSTAKIKLPVSQDYVIQCVSTGDSDENFKITFEEK